MRLNRLDLIRYGRFDGAAIDFPRHSDGTRDVTVIYGPNEAGKSTAFAGYLELLYGMKPRDHPYAFRFGRNDLLVGAELDLPGRGTMVLRRNGKRSQSLLDEQGRPVEEAILSGALHGLDREAYVERFSLNDASLRDGGSRIAGAQGDLGQLLHAGVSGLTSLSGLLDGMATRADDFHKKGGRATKLKQGKDRLVEIRRQLRAEALTPEREAALAQARDTARAAFEAADTDLAQARSRQVAAEAAQTWYDQSEIIRQADAALAGYPQGPDLPEGMAARVGELVATLEQTNDRITEAEAQIAAHDRVLAETPLDPVAGDLTAELERLETVKIDGAALISRADTAHSDLTRRRQERDAKAGQIAKVLADLGVAEADAVALLSAADDLEALAAAAQACLTADLETKAARSALRHAEDQRGDAPEAPQDMTRLRAAWQAWQSVADLSVAETTLDSARARLAKAVVGLPQDWESLLTGGLPTRETLESVARDWAARQADLGAAAEALAERNAEHCAAKHQCEAAEAAPTAIDGAAIEASRRQRDAAWAAHRATLSAETAAAFETAMHADDSARANFLFGAEARQKLAAARDQLAAAKARLETAQERHETLRRACADCETRAQDIAAALGLSAGAAPAGFVGRLAALQTAGELAAECHDAQSALNTRRNRRTAALADLLSAAREVGVNGPEEAVLASLPATLASQDSIRKAWDKWRADGQTIEDLAEAVVTAEAAQSAAETALAQRTAGLPLPDRRASGLQTALPGLRMLQRYAGEHQQLCARVRAMEDAVATLKSIAQRIAACLGETVEDDSNPMPLIDRARKRVAAAEQAARLRESETRQRAAEQQARDRARSARDAADAQLAACFSAQGPSDLPPRERVAHLGARDALRGKRAAAETERRAARAAVAAALFEEELQQLPSATRDAALQQALADAQTARDRARDAHVEAERLYREAFAADAQGDLATEQATLLEDLRSGARQAAVARLGVLAARAALKRLAAERRSTMLKDVEDAFVAMTAPAWSRVDVWSEAEGEKLIGVQPDGSTVPVAAMSTGTMGQLYFALRLAGYRSFARDPGPLPMILDDIMETFDDARASAALRLCAEIGENGQAIIFTHHAHLVDLARASIPGVAVVEMPR